MQTQITELCESVVSTLTPDFCAAVQGKTLRADLASYRMDNLLDCLLRYNCDDLEKRYRLKKKVVNSDEWKKFVDEIARVHSAAAKDSSNIEEPLGPAPAQPSPATVVNDGNMKDRKIVIDAFIAKVECEEGKKITRKDISTVAGYTDRTEFQRFQCGHKKATPTSKQKFDRVLAMESQAFIQALNKKQEKK